VHRLFERRIELKTVAFQIVFSTTLLYYTVVKFKQEKNETGIRRWGNAGPGGCAPAAAVTIRSVEGNPAKWPGLLIWPLRWLRIISERT
jgi:hypothetical protein